MVCNALTVHGQERLCMRSRAFATVQRTGTLV